jgi:hypothetical protein
MGGSMVIELVVALAVWFLEKFVFWSLLVSLALWWGKSAVVFRPSRLFLLLVLGLVEDITMVHYLGLTSVLVISLMMISWLVSRHYQNRQLWWWYLLGVMGELAIMAIHRTGFNLTSLLLQIVFLVLINWWSGRFGRQDTIYVKT